MPIMTYAQAINAALAEEMERDSSVIVYGQDVGAWGGIFNVTTGLQEQFGEERVFDFPISENALIGAGVGAAIMGMRPVAELQYADFLLTAGDEIFLKAAMWRFMHGGAFKVPLVVRLPSGCTSAGPEHSSCPEAYVMHSPGLLCAVPSTPADARTLLKQAIRNDNPVMYFEHRLLYQRKDEVPDEEEPLAFGQAAVRRKGDAVTIVAWQLMLQRALRAADALAADGISVEIIDPRTLNPFDWDTLIESVKKTGACLIVEEGYRTLGVGAEIGAVLFERALPWLDLPLRRLSPPDVPLAATRSLSDRVIPSAEAIEHQVRSMLNGNSK